MKQQNEKFADIFDQIWPKISNYFTEEIKEKIRIKARKNVLKSSVKEYDSKKARNIMFKIIQDAVFLACFINKKSTEKLTEKFKKKFMEEFVKIPK